LGDSSNRGCLSCMLCSILQQNFFPGSKGPFETLTMAHVALPHEEKHLLTAPLVRFALSFPQRSVFLRAQLWRERTKAGCTQRQSLELGSTRSLTHYPQCNSLHKQPSAPDVTRRSKPHLPRSCARCLAG